MLHRANTILIHLTTKKDWGHAFFSPLKCNLEDESWDTDHNKTRKSGGSSLFFLVHFHATTMSFTSAQGSK